MTGRACVLPQKWTALHYACAETNDLVVSKLVDLGADVNASDNEVSAQPHSLWCSATLLVAVVVGSGHRHALATLATALFCAEQHGGDGCVLGPHAADRGGNGGCSEQAGREGRGRECRRQRPCMPARPDRIVMTSMMAVTVAPRRPSLVMSLCGKESSSHAVQHRERKRAKESCERMVTSQVQRVTSYVQAGVERFVGAWDARREGRGGGAVGESGSNVMRMRWLCPQTRSPDQTSNAKLSTPNFGPDIRTPNSNDWR
eukprot:354680-Rhodomonas_salina.1